jgi:hypothetical protein
LSALGVRGKKSRVPVAETSPAHGCAQHVDRADRVSARREAGVRRGDNLCRRIVLLTDRYRVEVTAYHERGFGA